MNMEQSQARIAKLERELDEARKEVGLHAKMKDDFLSRISHELRTPLNAIMGMGELMSGTSLDATQTNYLSMINQSTQQLLRLVNEILDFSQLQLDSLEQEKVDFDLFEDVLPLVRSMQEQAENKGLHYFMHADPALSGKMHGFPRRMAQVGTTLVQNALKFTDYGEILVRFEQFHSEGRPFLCIAVTDTGIGVPKENQEQIFQKFVTGPHSERYGGIGMGLAIAAELVEKMGGKIWVDSELYLGSTFYVTLPLSRVADESRATSPLGPFKVLLAEDEPVNQYMTIHLLNKQGHEVTAVPNGLEALEALARDSFDLVLMDISMPKMDGLEAARVIRSGENANIDSTIPIIALTAMVMPTDRQQCLAAGMNAYVTKPANMAKLEEVMNQVVSAKAGQ